MIIWLASYPKSGNTWLRALLCSYYYTEDGHFNFNLLEKIDSFPQRKFFLEYSKKFETPTDTTNYWIDSQVKINKNKKIRFFKTHNWLCNINGNNFTDKKNTLGCIYIIRDPRNVMTSVKNQYEFDYSQTINFMLGEKKFIIDDDAKDFGDIQFISSWSNHYKSWLNHKVFPVKLIKYENMVKNTLKTFKEVIEFINKITNNLNKFDKKKAQKSVNSVSFDKLKSKENKGEFTESIYSKYNKKKLTFFNLGPKNNWKKIIPKKMHEQINDKFKNDLKFLNYK